MYVYVCHIAIRIQTPQTWTLREMFDFINYTTSRRSPFGLIEFGAGWFLGNSDFPTPSFCMDCWMNHSQSTQADCGSIKNPNWEWTRTYHICHCCLTTIIPIWINVEDSDKGSSLSTLAPGRMYSFTATMPCRAVASRPSALLQLRGLLKAVMAAA